MDRVRRILIVVDATAACREAVSQGVALARSHDAEVLFLHVLPHPSAPILELAWVALSDESFVQAARQEGRRILRDAGAIAEGAGVMHRSVMRQAVNDVSCIVETAAQRRCDLVVIPCGGGNALTRLLGGSVVPGLITASPVPVIVCKSATPAGGEGVGRVAASPAPARPGEGPVCCAIC